MAAIIIGNRYELIEKIGSGGMAVVYKARCRLLSRYVAVKMLRPEYNDDMEFLKRFETEAQAAASLSHSNIVSVYDVGIHDKIHYIVMEYAEGVTLKQYMKDKTELPIDKVINFSLQIASALCHAHSKGIVHHDIKPHNIMVGPGGVLKVTDFGLARAVSSSTNVASDSAIGSVHYASPEQSRGGFTDEKSDIYSLGVTMYEMVTGKVPFDGETPVAVAMKHMQKTPVPPSNINPAVTRELEMTILCAMQKEPRNRYQKVTDMIDNLTSANAVSDVEAVLKNDCDDNNDKFATKKFEAVESETDQLSKGKSNFRKASVDKNKYEIGNITENEPNDPSPIYMPDVPLENSNSTEGNNKKIVKKKDDRVAIIAAIFTTVAIVAVLSFIFLKLYASDFSFNGNTVVPKLVGISYEQAEIIAETEGFNLLVETKKSDDDEGMILEQDPAEGEKVKKGGNVSIVISEAEDGVVLINYIGKDYERAIKALETLGVKYIIEEEYNDEMDLGSIIKMEPKAGDTIKKGQKVTLYVSLGKDGSKKLAPDLRGKTIEEATEILSQEGLRRGNVIPESSDSTSGTIIRQSPVAGSNVILGASVDIVVSVQRTEQSTNQNQSTVRKPTESGEQSKSEQNTTGSVNDNSKEEKITEADRILDDVKIE